jgi:ketosteroid isomerase-like protein
MGTGAGPEEGRHTQESDAIAAVRRLLETQQSGDEDAAVACTHPDVVIRPTRRPGLSVYIGHDQLRRLVRESSREATEIAWSDFEQVSATEVRAVGAVRDRDGQQLGLRRCEAIVRDGLVAVLETYAEG